MSTKNISQVCAVYMVCTVHNTIYVFVVVDKVKKQRKKKGTLLTRLNLIFPTGKIPNLMVILWI